MKKRIVIISVFFALCAIVLAQTLLTPTNENRMKWLSPKDQKKAGLHKLTPTEQAALDTAILRMIVLFTSSNRSVSTTLGNSAVAYLRNQGELDSAAVEFLQDEGELGYVAVQYLNDEGWDEVTVLGTREIDSEDHLVVRKGYTTYILEPRGYFRSRSWDRGEKYLGKMSWTSCEIIEDDGDSTNFWTHDTE